MTHLTADARETANLPPSIDLAFLKWILMFLSDHDAASLLTTIVERLTPGGVLNSRAAVGAVGAAGAIRILGSGSAIVAHAIRGEVARLRAGLRAGEAHHQGEEEHADEPRRGPKAARRAAPSRGSARGRGSADGTAPFGRPWD